MSEENKNSRAKIDAIRRYEAKKYDIVSVRLPKGTKERITATGTSVNAYVVAATLDRLEQDGP